MNKKEILQNISFGESIAELESALLNKYFLETEYWKEIIEGKKDIVYGSKGAGKSAIYTNISNNIDHLFSNNILIALAENPSGNTVFANLKNDPPTTQTEFIRLWKLYFLVISVNVLNDYEFKDEYTQKLNKILSDCNLIPAQNKLSSFLHTCFNFMKSFKNGKEISTTAEIDPNTGQYIGQKFSVTFGEPTKSDFEKGLLPIEYIFDLLANSIKANGILLWIIIDRLDVAFIESEDLEVNALRALFKTYLDLANIESIKLKIFLRDDIWKKITEDGFREASHITKFVQISWTKETLLNLLIKRLLNNDFLVGTLSLDKNKILDSITEQENLFYKLFPSQVDNGAKKPKTLDWLLSRTRDGNYNNTPREIIQLFTHAKGIELKKLESGINDLYSDNIISNQSLKDALNSLSKQKIELSIYAEFPKYKIYIELLRGDKAEHSIQTLSKKWSLSESNAKLIAKNLSEIGIFELLGDPSNTRYKIPFLYRPYLEIIQGAASIDE